MSSNSSGDKEKGNLGRILEWGAIVAVFVLTTIVMSMMQDDRAAAIVFQAGIGFVAILVGGRK